MKDLARIAEIFVFNYRLYFYPIFRDDDYYFKVLQVPSMMKQLESSADEIWVYDDGAVKGFVHVVDGEIRKLFVEPVFQGHSVGSSLLLFAAEERGANSLWALEKNSRAIRFYERHGFRITTDKRLEEGTSEFLIRLER